MSRNIKRFKEQLEDSQKIVFLEGLEFLQKVVFLISVPQKDCTLNKLARFIQPKK